MAKHAFCSLCRNNLYTRTSTANRHCRQEHEGDLSPVVPVDEADAAAVEAAIRTNGPLPPPYGNAPVSVAGLNPALVPVVPALAPIPSVPTEPLVLNLDPALEAAQAEEDAAPPRMPTRLPPPPPMFATPRTLRSSRSGRVQEHHAAGRNRGLDFDPTDGLPVQKWQQVTVEVNQEPPSDLNAAAPAAGGMTATSSSEWASQFNTPQFPWPEKPLPSFFSQLSPWNQEFIRRARCGNTNPTISQYNPKTNSYTSAAELEKRKNAPKNDVNEDSNEASAPHEDGAAEHESGSEHDEPADEEMGDGDDENNGHNRSTPFKRRKTLVSESRTFDAKRWIQVPLAEAEKQEERKFLADRRPGMPSLYGGAYQNQVFGPMGLSVNGYNNYGYGSTSYEVADNAGLGANMGGVDQSAATPVRRNMPPKRKKKKGGPGRKRRDPNADPNTAQNGLIDADGDTGMSGTNTPLAGDTAQDNRENDDEGSSESDGEGSEEGEIGEPADDKQNEQAQQPISVLISDEAVPSQAPPALSDVEVTPLVTTGGVFQITQPEGSLSSDSHASVAQERHPHLQEVPRDSALPYQASPGLGDELASIPQIPTSTIDIEQAPHIEPQISLPGVSTTEENITSPNLPPEPELLQDMAQPPMSSAPPAPASAASPVPPSETTLQQHLAGSPPTAVIDTSDAVPVHDHVATVPKSPVAPITTESETASSMAPVSNQTDEATHGEPDLLGGLEKSLDRDMQS